MHRFDSSFSHTKPLKHTLSPVAQFAEVSHPRVEAFSVNSGVTQPQVSEAATTVPTLKSERVENEISFT